MSSPSTPQHAPPLPQSPSLTAIRRVHTLPTRLVHPTNTPPQVNHAADAVDTLLSLDFAKVVAFEAAAPNSRPSSSAGPTTSANDEGIPWATPSERTLAAGPLRIYRVPNTGVSFLNSGPFLKPILQRSQCWCVDDDAKFVLRVREGSYYRIEVPSSTQEEKDQVEALKQTWDSLCRYEKTPCPFKKGYFEVEEKPPTPVRRPSLATKGKAKKWRLNKVWEPEDADRRAEFEERNRKATEQWKAISLRPTKRPEKLTRIGTDPTFVLPTTPPRKIHSFAAEKPSPLSFAKDVEATDSDYSSMDQLDGLPVEESSQSNSESIDSDQLEPNVEHLEVPLQDDNHSAEVPPESTVLGSDIVQSIPTSEDITAGAEKHLPVEEPHSESALEPPTADAETASISSSRDSFYSAEDIDDMQVIEPVILKPQLSLLRTPLHSRDSSITTTVPDTPRAIPLSPVMSQEPATPPLTADSFGSDKTNAEQSAITPPQTLRQRRPMTTLQIEDEEPSHLPPRLSIFSPTTSVGMPISKAVIQKTYAMLIGPPTHLVTLMLSIAARILHRFPGQHRHKIPGAWDTSDSDSDEDVDWDEADTEDDYGYPLQKISRFEDAKEEPSPAGSTTAADTAGHENETWEID